jgi:hypothetical protein
MPGSQWSSPGNSRAGSNPGSGEVTRVSSASAASVIQVSSTEVSRASSASSLHRHLTRSRSGSSVSSVSFPRYSPFERSGIFKSAPVYTHRTTPNGYHILNCYDDRAPAFSPVLPYDPLQEEGTPSGPISRTASAELPAPLRPPSRLSRVSSADSECLSRVSSAGSDRLSRVSSAGLSRVRSIGSIDLTLPPVDFVDSSAAVSRLSSAGASSAPLPEIIPLVLAEKPRRGIPKMICGTVARRTRSHEKRIQEQKKLDRTRSAEAVKLGPEGALLSVAAKKIEAIALSRSKRK